MSEFSTASIMPDPSQTAPSQKEKENIKTKLSAFMQKKLLLGLTPPWIGGFLSLFLLFSWYLFSPEKPQSVPQLSFQHEEPLEEMGSNSTKPQYSMDTYAISKIQNDVTNVIDGVKSFSEANRSAIERLSETVKVQYSIIEKLQKQLQEAKDQQDRLTNRISVLENRSKSNAYSIKENTKKRPNKKNALSGMRIESIQDGMVWIYWQDKTWALQKGDTLGNVTITGIDAEKRNVSTSVGLLR